MVLDIWVDKNRRQEGRQQWSWAFGSTKIEDKKVDKNGLGHLGRMAKNKPKVINVDLFFRELKKVSPNVKLEVHKSICNEKTIKC